MELQKRRSANIILDWARADLALIQYAEATACGLNLSSKSRWIDEEKASGNEESEDQKNLSKQIADRLERLAELYGGEGKNEQSASLYKKRLRFAKRTSVE